MTCRAISEPSSLVGRRERLVAQQQGVRGDGVGDLAHPAEFFVQFAALHGGVFLPLEVGEDAVDDTGAQRPGRHEHAALQHQLRHPDAAQEGRLPALVRAGDHDQRSVIGVQLVAHDACLCAQRQTDVIQPVGGQRAGVGRDGLRPPGGP